MAGVGDCLHGEKIDVAKELARDAPKSTVAAKTARAHASIDDGNLGALSARQAQKIRPHFAFGEYHQRGAHGGQHASNRPGEIEGPMEDWNTGESFLGFVVAGIGRCGDCTEPIGMSLAKLLDDRAQKVNLSRRSRRETKRFAAGHLREPAADCRTDRGCRSTWTRALGDISRWCRLCKPR